MVSRIRTMVSLGFLLIPLLLSFSSGVSWGKIVTHLPGFSGPLPFHLETGYESVGSTEFFYYFVQSEGNPGQDPVIVWLTGGPGCSSITGLAFEIGPIRFVAAENNKRSLPTLVYDNRTWTKFANIIFLDSPVGTGFSFSRRPQATAPSDTSTSIQCYEFLRQWYKSHPQFLPNPLYIAGDSYGGKIVPLLTHRIAHGNDVPPFLNLKGYLVGNPCTSEMDAVARPKYAHNMGIISDELYKEINEACTKDDSNSPNVNNMSACNDELFKFGMFLSELWPYNILEFRCSAGNVALKMPEIFGNERHLDYLSMPSNVDVDECRKSSFIELALYNWMNTSAAREALHVEKGSVAAWAKCNLDVTLSFKSDIPSTVEYHHDIAMRGYRSLIYSGDQDMVVPFIATHAWIKSLNFSIVDDWRSWHVDGQVAGYTERFANNLTFATVKNAGHTAPHDMPEACFAMVKRWISGDSL